MFAATLGLTLLGATLGLLLGIANRFLRVESDPVADELLAMLPGTNCGQCGFPGCAGAVAAIVAGTAPPTCCPSIDRPLAGEIAVRLGRTLEAAGAEDTGPRIAAVIEELCIGCCRCGRSCPTDAILGAARQLHAVFRDACTGCAACIDTCPTEALVMQPVPVTLGTWVMPRPIAA